MKHPIGTLSSSDRANYCKNCGYCIGSPKEVGKPSNCPKCKTLVHLTEIKIAVDDKGKKCEPWTMTGTNYVEIEKIDKPR